MQYITEVLEGTVTAEKYGEPAGRITIVGEAAEKPEEPAPAEKPAEPAPEEKPAGSANTYEVVKGDSLWKIAQNFYGSGAEWTVIYEANKDLDRGKSKSDFPRTAAYHTVTGGGLCTRKYTLSG